MTGKLDTVHAALSCSSSKPTAEAGETLMFVRVWHEVNKNCATDMFTLLRTNHDPIRADQDGGFGILAV